jgi:hypothetical protein
VASLAISHDDNGLTVHFGVEMGTTCKAGGTLAALPMQTRPSSEGIGVPANTDELLEDTNTTSGRWSFPAGWAPLTT